MLRELGQMREDGTPYLRKGEKDADDSVFVVLLAIDVDQKRFWQIASIWTTVGEAKGAANRYITMGHPVHPDWEYCVVMEYQTGQPVPKAERHGDEYRPPRPVDVSPASKLAALELEIARLRASMGTTTAAGPGAAPAIIPGEDPRTLVSRLLERT